MRTSLSFARMASEQGGLVSGCCCLRESLGRDKGSAPEG